MADDSHEPTVEELRRMPRCTCGHLAHPDSPCVQGWVMSETTPGRAGCRCRKYEPSLVGYSDDEWTLSQASDMARRAAAAFLVIEDRQHESMIYYAATREEADDLHRLVTLKLIDEGEHAASSCVFLVSVLSYTPPVNAEVAQQPA